MIDEDLLVKFPASTTLHDAQSIIEQIQELGIMAHEQKQKDKELSHIYKVLKLLILLLPEPQRGLLSAVFDGGKNGKKATGQLLDLLEENGVDVSSLRNE